MLSACETSAPKPILPPSESDLVLLKSATLCTSKSDFLKTHPASTLKPLDWGAGQELVLPADRSPSHGDESYFFDEDGMLVGTVFTFPSGLDLNPYPVLRHTLTLLKPTLEFYLNVANLSSKTSMDSSALYETGDEKTTTQYLVLGTREKPTLLQASVTIDPYVRLFSPYRREFLERLRHPSGPETRAVSSTVKARRTRNPFSRSSNSRAAKLHSSPIAGPRTTIPQPLPIRRRSQAALRIKCGWQKLTTNSVWHGKGRGSTRRPRRRCFSP